MRAGTLDRRLSVQSRASTKDALGGQSAVWTEIKKVWGRIDTLSVAAKMAAQAEQTDITHQIEVRYDASLWADPRVYATYRIVYMGRYFDIRGGDNQEENNRNVLLRAAEGMTAG